MVDDPGDVLVAVREFVDFDVRESVEHIWSLATCDDSLDDRPTVFHATRIMSLTIVSQRCTR